MIGRDIFDFFSATAEQNSTKLDEVRSQHPLQVWVGFVGAVGKPRWPPGPLISLDIFDVFSATVEQNSTKLIRKQDLHVLYKIRDSWVDLKTSSTLWLA